MVTGRTAARTIRDRAADAALLTGLLVAAAAFMFVDRATPPIVLWDESRLAVNALEMVQRGWSLVTTYGFVPDLWNTKPPLMIWLMTASMQMFGPSELALRLPAMIAALGTLVVVFVFVRKATASRAAASLAVVLLATSIGFYGAHGARTADYDALMCLFTTAYVALLYALVHRCRPGWALIIAAAALIAGATLTKTIAGLMPGVGVAVYVVLAGRTRRVIANPRHAVMLIAALVPLALFYLVRERVAPGFIDAALFNDALGRLTNHLEYRANPPWFYVENLLVWGSFTLGPLVLLAPWAIRAAPPRARQAGGFALCCFAVQLLLVSVVKTRIYHYLLPAMPWLAIACAIGIDARVRQARRPRDQGGLTRRERVLAAAVLGVMTLAIGSWVAFWRYDILVPRAFYPQSRYGDVLAALHDRAVRQVMIVDPGISVGGELHYAPQLRFYALIWQRRGMTIAIRDRLPDRWPDVVVASCDPELRGVLLARAGSVVGQTGCSLAPPGLIAGK